MIAFVPDPLAQLQGTQRRPGDPVNLEAPLVEAL